MLEDVIGLYDDGVERHDVRLVEDSRGPSELKHDRTPEPGAITVLLTRISGGDRGAIDELIGLVYHELHRIAEGYLSREQRRVTLQPTALIHETYLKLLGSTRLSCQNRRHFYGIAARIMRQILVDHARARRTAKRDLGARAFIRPAAPESDRVVIALDDALKKLANEAPSKAQLVELRFFAGMTVGEISECVQVPAPIVRRQLSAARAWLRREMSV